MRYFTGVLRLMAGRRDGLQRLDISPDGFWSSFGAIVVALPPMALSWIEYEFVEREWPFGASTFSTYGAHALSDLTAWLLPLLILMLVAPRIGLRRKVGPIIVALNWTGALLAWALVPLWFLMIVTGGSGFAILLLFLASLATLFLTWRVVSLAGDCDPLAAAGIVALMVVTSVMAPVAVVDMTGIALL